MTQMAQISRLVNERSAPSASSASLFLVLRKLALLRFRRGVGIELCLLVRHDPDGVTRRYVHIGTGNYNPSTARFYTDLSLLTSSPEITSVPGR